MKKSMGAVVVLVSLVIIIFEHVKDEAFIM